MPSPGSLSVGQRGFAIVVSLVPTVPGGGGTGAMEVEFVCPIIDFRVGCLIELRQDNHGVMHVGAGTLLQACANAGTFSHRGGVLPWADTAMHVPLSHCLTDLLLVVSG